MLPPACAEVTGTLLSALLGALDRVEWVQRQLFPPRAATLARRLSPHAEPLGSALRALEAAEWPDDLRFLRDRLRLVAQQALDLIDAFAGAAPAWTVLLNCSPSPTWQSAQTCSA